MKHLEISVTTPSHLMSRRRALGLICSGGVAVGTMSLPNELLAYYVEWDDALRIFTAASGTVLAGVGGVMLSTGLSTANPWIAVGGVVLLAGGGALSYIATIDGKDETVTAEKVPEPVKKRIIETRTIPVEVYADAKPNRSSLSDLEHRILNSYDMKLLYKKEEKVSILP